MNFKYSLSALAVASVISGQAQAAMTAAQVTALADLSPDTTWITNTGGGSVWAGIDTSTPLTNSLAWDASTTPDPCDWVGIACDSGNITHVEIPNANMNKTLTEILAALTPAIATLKTLNVSSTAGPDNTLGDVSGTDISAFTALTHLAINNTSGTGDLPDMSALDSLVYFNAYNNAFTSLGGLSTSLTQLRLYNNPDLTGEIPSPFVAITTLMAHSTKLNGVLSSTLLPGAGGGGLITNNWSIVGTGIIPDAAAAAFLTEGTIGTNGSTITSYDPATALRVPTVGAIQNTAKDGLDLTFAANVTAGATPADYTVEYKMATDTAWIESSTSAPTGGYTIPTLAAGDYEVRIRANTATAQSSWSTVATATIDATVTPPTQQAKDDAVDAAETAATAATAAAAAATAAANAAATEGSAAAVAAATAATNAATAATAAATAATAAADAVTAAGAAATQVQVDAATAAAATANTAVTAANDAAAAANDAAGVTPTLPKTGGGGAALWLAFLPLLALVRRRRA